MCRRRPSASSQFFSALVVLGLVGRDGGHGELMKDLDAIAAKLYPPVLSVDRRRDRHETTVVSYNSDPRRLLQNDGSTDALEIYDGRLKLDDAIHELEEDEKFGEGSEALQVDKERNLLWLLSKVRYDTIS